MAEFSTIDGRVLGLVLDISLRFGEDGKRILDTVKEQLVSFLREDMDGEDLFYLFHPDILEPVETVGNMVGIVSNYETDGWLHDVSYALMQTFLVVASEDEDYERVVLFVTDRIQEDKPVRRLLKLEENSQSDCKFIFVGIGSQYKQKVFEDSATFHHIDTPSELADVLLDRRANEEEL